jgi:hypothetical protein
MSSLLRSVVLAAGLVVAQPGAAQVPGPPPFQVVRLGDGQMSCEALIGEINSLNAEMERVQRDMMGRAMAMSREATQSLSGGGLGGAAMSLGGLAAGFIPGGELLMGAASMAAQAQMSHQMNEMTSEAETMASEGLVVGPISQRLEHLTEISRDRRC